MPEENLQIPADSLELLQPVLRGGGMPAGKKPGRRHRKNRLCRPKDKQR